MYSRSEWRCQDVICTRYWDAPRTHSCATQAVVAALHARLGGRMPQSLPPAGTRPRGCDDGCMVDHSCTPRSTCPYVWTARLGLIVVRTEKRSGTGSRPHGVCHALQEANGVSRTSVSAWRICWRRYSKLKTPWVDGRQSILRIVVMRQIESRHPSAPALRPAARELPKVSGISAAPHVQKTRRRM